MKDIQFQAVVGDEQVIRPPEGVVLPLGTIEVTVRPSSPETSQQDSIARTRAWLLRAAAEAEACTVDLPPDLAERHDHYAHGTP